MHEAELLLRDLTIVLGVAAIISVVFRKVGQPAVLGYLLAGLIIGPYIPFPIFADAERVHALSELGVILVMLSVGLEFSLRKLIKVIPTSGLIGVVQVGLMLWLGNLVAEALGFTLTEQVFAGAIVAISSTMIVAKTFAEQKVDAKLSDMVFGVLVVQDLAAIILVALLTTVSPTGGLTASSLSHSVLRLALFLAGLVTVGFLVVPRIIRAVARLGSAETLLIASVGLGFSFAWLARELGYSVALGAFLAGSLIAESGEGSRIEHLVAPLRDIFGAVFFVSVGMMVDPRTVLANALPIVAFTVLVLVGQTFSVTLGSVLAGNDLRRSVRSGMSLAQVGEFSFIIASLGVERGVVGPSLYPVAVSVSVITSFTTPFMVRHSDRAALTIERKLPHVLQTFIALYASWLERIRSTPSRASTSKLVRSARWIVIDAAMVAVIIIGAAVTRERAQNFLVETFGLASSLSRTLRVVATIALTLPFFFGMLRGSRAIGRELTSRALSARTEGEVPSGAAARVFETATQIGALLLVVVPLIAVTRPFVPTSAGVVIFFFLAAALGQTFVRRALSLEEDVRAGTEVILDVLARQSTDTDHALDDVRASLPALGELKAVELGAASHAVGRTLASLDLRGRTGATVIAVTRAGSGRVPDAHEQFQVGDVLAIAGAATAVDQAKSLIIDGPREIEMLAEA